MTEKTIYPLEDLKYIRIIVPRLIPSYLIELLKGRSFSTEDFYKYQEDRASIDNEDNLLYGIYDPEKIVVGFIWAEINQLDKTLFVNSFSIDKVYWNNGEAMNIALDILGKLVERFRCPKTFWMTTNPKYYQKHGFKLSKNVAMEYVGESLSSEIEQTFKRG